MELHWTKRKLIGLAHGDAETVRQWQSQFGRFIYTWFYYQVDKDESQAATLTAATLSAALGQLSSFDPDRTTMYVWLKAIAAGHLEAALSQQGVQAQRPWAWSQMPAGVFESLRRFRGEALAAEVPGCGAVVEMVQATLADLSEQDRDLLVRRYIRLDTVEHIASELSVSIEKVDRQLYLARHAFRRGLFYLLQSANSNFDEPAGAGGLDVFESNLETLLRSVNPAVMISADHNEQIKRAVLAAASEIAAHPPVVTRGESRFGWKKLIPAGVAVLAVIAALVLVLGRGTPPAPSAVPQEDVASVVEPATETSTDDEEPAIDVAEMQRILAIGVQGDVAGLLAVLETGSEFAQIIAAHYLGQYGDESAIDPLLHSQSQWFADGPDENPFSRAVLEIENRLYAEVSSTEPVHEALSEPTEPLDEEPVAEDQPMLSGRIITFDGAPASGVPVTVRPEGANAAAGVTASTDVQGRYAFETLPEGPCVVAVRDPQRRVADTQRLIWAVADRPCELDFGGSASVAGAVIVDDTPLAERTLLISDRFDDPQQGVFVAETQTDGDGGFYFTGLPDGEYGVFSRVAANRWTLLDRIEMAGADVSVLIDLPTVELLIQAGPLPEALGVVAVSLRYSPDSSDALAAWTAVRTEQEAVFRISGVIPSGYMLCVDFSNGVRVLREIYVDSQPEHVVVLDEIPFGAAGLAGRFESDWPEGLTLAAVDPMIRINVMAEEDGTYELDDLPAAMYALGATINRMFVPYLEFGLFEDEPAVFDPDPVQLAQSRSPLYVYVTDERGRGLSGGQVWLGGQDGIYMAQPFGRGFFVVAPPGRYALYTAFAGAVVSDQPVQLAASDIRAPRSSENTVVVRLRR